MLPNHRTILLAGLAGTLLAETLIAQAPPQLLHLQARLTDAGGAPLVGSQNLRVAVYDAAVGGNQLWLEAETATALNGVVSLVLGDASALPASLFSATDRWLALQVGADPEMTPRLRIASEPYALRAGSVAALDASTVIPPGTITSAHIADGAVSSLDIAASAVTTSKLADAAVTTTKIVASAVGGAAIAAGAIDGTKIADGSITNADVSGAAGIAGTKIAPNFGSQTLVTLGSVGIGTGTPGARLEVQESGSAAGVWGESATGFGVVGGAHAAGGGFPLFLPIAGVEGFNDAASGVGVWGWASADGGRGVRGDAWGASGDGVYGRTASSSGAVVGVRGESSSTGGTGVLGEALSTSGLVYGVLGRGHSSGGYGGYFENSDGFALRAVGTTGVKGEATAPNGDAVFGQANATSGAAWGVRGESFSSSGIGVRGEAVAISGTNYGVYGQANSTGGFGGYFRNTSAGIGTYVEGKGKGAASAALRVHNPEAVQGMAGFFTNTSNYHTLHLENTGTGGVLWMRNAGADTFITAIDENNALKFAVDASGKTTTKVLQILGGSDLSEGFDVAPVAAQSAEIAPEPGLVVCIDPANPGKLAVSRGAYDRTVAGVISGAGGVQPGMLMGQEGSVADGEHPVALSGRVYVRCDASSGAIRPGDLLTTSDVPGHAMRAADRERAPGACLGKAMSALDEGRGLVLVLVTLQ